MGGRCRELSRPAGSPWSSWSAWCGRDAPRQPSQPALMSMMVIPPTTAARSVIGPDACGRARRLGRSALGFRRPGLRALLRGGELLRFQLPVALAGVPDQLAHLRQDIVVVLVD